MKEVAEEVRDDPLPVEYKEIVEKYYGSFTGEGSSAEGGGSEAGSE